MSYHLRYRNILIVIVAIVVLSSCSQTKYVPEGEFLLAENEVVITKDSLVSPSLLNKTGITTDQLSTIIKQKPNRRIIIGKFHLWLYNRSNQERIDRNILKKQTKVNRKNAKITAKNQFKLVKNPDYNVRDTLERKNTFGESLRSAGEAPILLDSLKIAKSAQQMHLYLLKKGYFKNTVESEVVFLEDGNTSRKNRKKAKVIYAVKPNEPYKINTYTREIKDKAIEQVLSSLAVDSLIKQGNNFDTDVLEAERKRITKYLWEKGFYYFNQEFIFYRVDSAVGNRKVDLSLGIQNFKIKDLVRDTLIDKPHKAFKIGVIEIYPDHSPKDDEYTDYAVVNLHSIDLYHKYKLKIKSALLVNSVLFKEGDLYKKSLEEATYKKFMALGNFRSVSMRYDTTQGNLRVRIYLEPSKAQTFNVATDGTQTNGLFGIEGSMTYTHSNVFGGAEKLQISMSGGLEMQRLIFDSDSSSIAEDGVSNFS